MTSSPTDPLGEIPVHEVVGTFYGVFDNTMLPGRVVSRTWQPLRFARHAFFKSDIAPTLLARSKGPPDENAYRGSENLAKRY